MNSWVGGGLGNKAKDSPNLLYLQVKASKKKSKSKPKSKK